MRQLNNLLVLACLVWVGSHASAMAGLVTTYRWDFGTQTGTAAGVKTGSIDITAGNFSIGNSPSNINNPISDSSASAIYSGASGSNNLGNIFRFGGLNTSTSGYFEVSLSNNSLNPVTLTSFAFGFRRTPSGPINLSLRANPGNFSSEIAGASGIIQNQWQLQSFSSLGFVLQPNSTTTFRLYGFGGSGSSLPNSPNGRIDDIVMEFSAIPEPTALLMAGGVVCMVGFSVRRTKRRKF